jgi:hypothetical protein
MWEPPILEPGDVIVNLRSEAECMLRWHNGICSAHPRSFNTEVVSAYLVGEPAAPIPDAMVVDEAPAEGNQIFIFLLLLHGCRFIIFIKQT